MDYWTALSVSIANQQNYLDRLFKVYPTIPDAARDIDTDLWERVSNAYEDRNNKELIKRMLDFELFPIKDSYVAFLRKDKGAIDRNPETINRLAGRMYEMGLSKIYEKCSEPKETNRQIGPMFKRWISNGSLGVPVLQWSEFLSSNINCVLDGSDEEMKRYASMYLGYTGQKGIDFIGKFGGKHVVGETKFLTDYGGHQNAQLNDALALLGHEEMVAERIAILDGVVYIEPRTSRGNKMYDSISSGAKVMSALVLQEYLYSI